MVKRARTVPILVSFLLTSLSLQMFDLGGGAVAQEVDAPADPPVEEPTLAEAFEGQALDSLLNDFVAREERILAREAEIEQAAADVEAARQAVLEKIVELTDVESRLRNTLSLADTAATNDLERLTRVYQTMKPEDAARLFTEMTPNFAAGFIGMMQEENAAAILAQLEPEIGHTLSVIIAARNVNAFNEAPE